MKMLTSEGGVEMWDLSRERLGPLLLKNKVRAHPNQPQPFRNTPAALKERNRAGMLTPPV